MVTKHIEREKVMKPVSIHILELPLDKEVSRQTKFLSFVKDLGTPIKYTFLSQYFKERFRVSASGMTNADGGLGRTASVKVKKGVSDISISRFASKLNVAMSLDSKSRDISIEVDTSAHVLSVKIEVKTLVAEMALNNIWTVIDSSAR